MVYRHISGHCKHKSGLTHSRSGCNDYQIRWLPSVSNAVYSCITAWHAAKTILPVLNTLKFCDCLTQYILNALGLPLHIPVCQVEYLLLRGIQQIIYRNGVIERVSLNLVRDGYKLSLYIFLDKHLCVILQMCGRSYLHAQLRQIIRPAYLF